MDDAAPAPTLGLEEAQSLWREGGAALRAGDLAAASCAFRLIVDGGRADAVVWLGLAIAHRRTGDAAGAMAAVDAALALAPRDLRALMLKGDLYVDAGDTVSAAPFHRAVVEVGGATPNLPPDLKAEVARAQAAASAASARFQAHLEETLRRRGLDGPGGRRVAASLALMRGEAEIYLQQPTQYYFPELPQIQFYPRELTPWLSAVEAAFPDIRAELDSILEEDGAFEPYVRSAPNRPDHQARRLLNDPSWSAFYLVKDGREVEGAVERCPRTLAVLRAAAPLCDIPGRTPSILFSLLRPGARIPPHTGLLNTRLIGHLGLIVPEGCGFRVGAETRAWREGEAFAFDDSIEHEAWNDSDRTRVVLIFDVWRPELTALERDLVGAVVQASTRFGSGAL